MNLWKKINLFFIGVLAGYLFFSIVPATQGFNSLEHSFKTRHHLMMHGVHKDHWIIGYMYVDDCRPEDEKNAAELEKAITTVLQLLLQPLRDINTAQPIVNDFRYKPRGIRDGEDLINDARDREHLREEDLRIVVNCVNEIRTSRAIVISKGLILTPRVEMRTGSTINGLFKRTLLHEIGHTFGLADTYVGRLEKPDVSTGGLHATVGTQPASIMSHLGFQADPFGGIGKDDENGIIWLYKRIHEKLPLEDCFFPNYELEKSPDGCRPKYPLIFELKQAGGKYALHILRDDNKLDINAIDGDGLTALHHAVLNRYGRVVKALLARDGIDPNIKDQSGKTPLEVARELGFADLVILLTPEPDEEPEQEVEDVRPVSAKGNLTTLWGALKRER